MEIHVWNMNLRDPIVDFRMSVMMTEYAHLIIDLHQSGTCAISSCISIKRIMIHGGIYHDDVIKWEHFPHYWLFVCVSVRVGGWVGGDSPVPGEFPAQRPVTRSLMFFFDLRLNKRLGKQWWCWLFEMPSRPLWRHCNDGNKNQHILEIMHNSNFGDTDNDRRADMDWRRMQSHKSLESQTIKHFITHIIDQNFYLQIFVLGITHLIFSCDQAALWMVFSVRLSVCLSVCHTFLTMFPSSYHHEIFRSHHLGPG